jgi:hypothetical protein
MATQYQKLPVPGYHNPIADYVDPEILYSTVGFTQKGVTLASGQGVLAAGTILAMKTSDKKYYAYDGAGGAGGLNRARGVLRRPCDTGVTVTPEGDQVTNMVIAGIVKYNMLQGADADAYTDLGMTIDPERGTAKF